MLRYAIHFFLSIWEMLLFLPVPVLFLRFIQGFPRFAVNISGTNQTIFIFLDIYF